VEVRTEERRETPEASIIVRQARELGLRQPIFVGTASVDNALVANDGYAAEGVIGAWPLPLFPDSDDPDMVKFRDAWSKLNPNAPKGHPNLFDVYAYGDTYVIAEAMKRAGRDLTRDKFVDALEAMKDYRVSGVATPRTFTTDEHRHRPKLGGTHAAWRNGRRAHRSAVV
jgi:branched-chain amino acid transport system substrate-binding protein